MKRYRGPKTPILIDQGTSDESYRQEPQSESFKQICGKRGYPLSFRMQTGYDSSYFFISAFMKDHIEFHASNLGLQGRL
jgi:Predicted esterase